MKAHTQETRREALRLHAKGLPTGMIIERLGIHRSTLRRWTEPEYAERQKTHIRSYKQRIRGICARCGEETRYGGHGNIASTYCRECGASIGRETGIAKRGKGSVNGSVLDMLRHGERGWLEMRVELGITGNHLTVTLNRLLRYGLVERVSRGRYRIVE